jgi:hypothetical protein
MFEDQAERWAEELDSHEEQPGLWQALHQLATPGRVALCLSWLALFAGAMAVFLVAMNRIAGTVR